MEANELERESEREREGGINRDIDSIVKKGNDPENIKPEWGETIK